MTNISLSQAEQAFDDIKDFGTAMAYGRAASAAVRNGELTNAEFDAIYHHIAPWLGATTHKAPIELTLVRVNKTMGEYYERSERLT